MSFKNFLLQNGAHGAKLNIIISRLFLSQSQWGLPLLHARVDSFSQRLQRDVWNNKEKLVSVVTKRQAIISAKRRLVQSGCQISGVVGTQHCLKGQMELLHTDSAAPCNILSGPWQLERRWTNSGARVDSFSQRLQRDAWNSKENLVLVVTKCQDITTDGRIVQNGHKISEVGGAPSIV